MTTATRKPLPPELLARLRETGRTAILAGCTSEEAIALVKQTLSEWIAAGGRP